MEPKKDLVLKTVKLKLKIEIEFQVTGNWLERLNSSGLQITDSKTQPVKARFKPSELHPKLKPLNQHPKLAKRVVDVGLRNIIIQTHCRNSGLNSLFCTIIPKGWRRAKLKAGNRTEIHNTGNWLWILLDVYEEREQNNDRHFRVLKFRERIEGWKENSKATRQKIDWVIEFLWISLPKGRRGLVSTQPNCTQDRNHQTNMTKLPKRVVDVGLRHIIANHKVLLSFHRVSQLCWIHSLKFYVTFYLQHDWKRMKLK